MLTRQLGKGPRCRMAFAILGAVLTGGRDPDGKRGKTALIELGRNGYRRMRRTKSGGRHSQLRKLDVGAVGRAHFFGTIGATATTVIQVPDSWSGRRCGGLQDR